MLLLIVICYYIVINDNILGYILLYIVITAKTPTINFNIRYIHVTICLFPPLYVIK